MYIQTHIKVLSRLLMKKFLSKKKRKEKNLSQNSTLYIGRYAVYLFRFSCDAGRTSLTLKWREIASYFIIKRNTLLLLLLFFIFISKERKIAYLFVVLFRLVKSLKEGNK